MITSPDMLRKETARLMTTVSAEMKKYEDEAESNNESPFLVTNSKGVLGYTSLVAAKLSAMNTLALLNYNSTQRR